jgi:formiminotetrahydrofolate cyclodeaminase
LEAQKIKNPRGGSAAAIQANNLAGQMVIDMIAQLADGKLTYGQFNRQRTKNTLAADQIQ